MIQPKPVATDTGPGLDDGPALIPTMRSPDLDA